MTDPKKLTHVPDHDGLSGGPAGPFVVVVNFFN